MKTIERPSSLDEIIGQREVVARLKIVIAGARLRQTQAPHVLLSGPAGTGKTSLARTVAESLGAKLVSTSGPALRRSGDLAGMLCSLSKDALTVLFIDEIHRLPTVVEETLYEALEDGTISMVTGSGSEARSVSLKLAPVVVVGATTKPGAISTPMRDRFGFHASLAPYSQEEIADIVAREWSRNSRTFDRCAALEVARRSKDIPRLSLHLAARVLDVCAIERTLITTASVTRALNAFGIRENGLDETDWRILVALCDTFAGRSVGLDALAQALNLDAATIENEHEGYLVRLGLMLRTKSGRIAAPAAYEMVRA